ncbi:hypothetical protein R16034_00849 [Ralstonia edaphis]|uniref:Uncharacterized protein n=1 Tax=Ralstonia edaphi TaxID=3058599 RepID=A0AB72X2T2_9RALS|nr:hypothetical protein [Ralstonia sp. LMG 6871]CAJ0737792.1 hypothetical protein R16034_00849 [Ralstonia sp. LMG 6871]
MRVSDTEAAQRVADNDNLVGELVEALRGLHDAIDNYFGPSKAGPMWPKYLDPEMYAARAALAKAQGAQQ